MNHEDFVPVAGPLCFPETMPEHERAYWRWVAAIDRRIPPPDPAS